MAKSVVVRPLGLVLRKAGLVSSQQVQTALQESLVLPQCKIGEILAIRGLIHPETADFFAEVWPLIFQADSITREPTDKVSYRHKLLPNKSPRWATQTLQPLGQYLKAAHLIDDKQISSILEIQQHNSSKFGKIAVEQGLISQTTLEFFLAHLSLLKVEQEITTYPEKIALDVDRIERHLLDGRQWEPIALLHKYQAILERGSLVATGDRLEQELIASGLICSQKNILQIAKPYYKTIFNQDWIEQELARLQPYNQIRFKMFALNDKADIPYKIINGINYWTGQQPFLTQKLYQLIQEQSRPIASGEEATIISELVYERIINNWETGVAASHFRAICDRIIQNESCSATTILKTYKKIWQLQEITADGSVAQQELLQIGLIIKNRDRVSVSNPIYQAVFDRLWLEKLLDQMRSNESQPSLKISREKLIATLPKLPANLAQKTPPKLLTPSRSQIFSLVSLIAIMASLLTIPFLLKTIANPQQQDRNLERRNLFLPE